VNAGIKMLRIWKTIWQIWRAYAICYIVQPKLEHEHGVRVGRDVDFTFVMQIVPEELTLPILSAPLLQLQLHKSLLFEVAAEMPENPAATAGARAMTTPVTLRTLKTTLAIKPMAAAPQH
jgi:hypothetical protein